MTVRAHESALLNCRTQSPGEFEVQWRRRDVPLIRTTNVIEYPNGTLKVIDASKSDEGIYECELSNGAGSAAAQIFLRVLGKNFLNFIEKIEKFY